MPSGCSLLRKEEYEYRTAHNRYRIELFQEQSGAWYAVAVPLEGERLIVYGSPVVASAADALQAVVDKITRESPLLEGIAGAGAFRKDEEQPGTEAGEHRDEGAAR